MLNPDQSKIVSKSYLHLLSSERGGWSDIDEYLLLLDYLEDDQLFREASVLYDRHKNSVVSCTEDHPREACFVPLLVESSQYIIELFEETHNLHPKNRYILSYYLALDQAGMILTDNKY